MISPQISFEFFPPKTLEGIEQLDVCANELAKVKPQFYSVTFGAGGSTQDRTFEAVLKIKDKTQIDAAPHISCVSMTQENIASLLHQYKENNIKHLVVLRGDLPSGIGADIGDFHYACDLVHFIREQTGDHFHIEVAAHPEFHPQTVNAQLSFKHFQSKVNAGANSAITQYFYNADSYFRFVDSCQKLNINIPIVPGIMPITNYKQLARFSEICGAEIPRWIRFRLESFQDDLESLRHFGIEVVSDLCKRLLAGGAPGLHFYTLNRAAASLEILNNLS